MSTMQESPLVSQPWYTNAVLGPMVLGEAPIYRNLDHSLHWVDPLKQPAELHVLSLDPQSLAPIGEAKTFVLEDSVTVVCFRKSKKGYICAYYQGVAFLDEDTGKLEIVKEIIPKDQKGILRFNDGGVDAKGRFWLAQIDLKAASKWPQKMPADYHPIGKLWRYDPDGSTHEMESGVICGNGVGWSPDNKIMYFNDSHVQVTWAYDFDLESGSISNRRVFADFKDTGGEPDGLIVDTVGNVWMAVYGTSQVVASDPTGKRIKKITFSAKAVTCPTWGGQDLDNLFVTSASRDAPGADDGGNLFRYEVAGTRGLPKYEFDG